MEFSALDGWLRERATADQFSGTVLIRQAADTLFFGAYGPASRRWPVPITRATRFDCASITKLFTSVAALQLVDRGLLDLDRPITEAVELSGTTISPAVTLRHLLGHTSGIADDADEEAGEDYEALWATTPCYTIESPRDLLPLFAHKSPVFPPGEGCRYCNAGYTLVGLAIEAVTDTAYRDHVRDAVFGPAGMSSSGFYDRRDAVPDVAEGWDPVLDADGNHAGWRQNIFSYPSVGQPDGGAHVTADDLATFLQALRAGMLLSPERTEQFLTPNTHHHDFAGSSVKYGYGLEFVVAEDGTVRNYYKDGYNAGASGILRYYPADGIDVVVLSNSAEGAWEPVREIHRRIPSDKGGPAGPGFS